MNTSVDPCDDFYGYVCGGFVNRYKGDQITRKVHSLIKPVVDSRIKDILDLEYGSSPPLMREAVDFYKQCQTFNLTYNSAWELLFDHFESGNREYIGSWPIVTPNWNESEFNLSKAFAHIKTSHWFGAIYDIGYQDSDDNETKHALVIGFEKFPDIMSNSENIFAQDPSTGNSTLYSIMEVVRRFFVTHNVNVTENFAEDFLDIAQFSRKLTESQSNPSQSKMESFTLAELQRFSKTVDWIEVFKSLFGTQAISEQQIVFGNKLLLRQVDELLQRTAKRTIANVVHWKFLSRYIFLLCNCFETTKESFKHAIAAVYVEKFIERKTIRKIENDLIAVRAVFKKLLASAGWMDELTRQRAQEKGHPRNAQHQCCL